MPSRPSPGSDPGPVQVPSRVRRGPVQTRHVLCLQRFHPGPEVGAVLARPGPILVPSVPSKIGPGQAETDFMATSDRGNEGRAWTRRGTPSSQPTTADYEHGSPRRVFFNFCMDFVPSTSPGGMGKRDLFKICTEKCHSPPPPHTHT